MISLLFFQCGPDFQTNKRVLIKGQLLNDIGAPLEDIDVSAFTLNENDFQGNIENGYLLGRNKSGSDGSIAVVCLLDVNSDFFIRVNGLDNYIDYTYVFKTDLPEPENLSIDIGTVTLRQKAEINVLFTRISPVGTSIDYTILYQNPYCVEVYEDDDLILEESSCYEEISMIDNFDGTNTNFTNGFMSLLGSTVTIIYSINNQPETTETFTIDQPNYTYEFSY
ncbi:MAG: hypothetical protein ACSHXF_03795 [Aquaticitalea sp.]